MSRLHPVIADALAPFMPAGEPVVRSVAALVEARSDLIGKRRILASLVAQCERKLDQRRARLHALDLEIDQLDAQLDGLTGEGRR